MYIIIYTKDEINEYNTKQVNDLEEKYECPDEDNDVCLKPNKDNTVPTKNIKVYLEKLKSGTFTSTGNPVQLKLSNKKSKLGTESGSMVIYSNSTKKSVSENYRLRAWVDNTSLYVPTMTDKIVLDVDVHGKAS